jgi:hypothetical protein
MLNYSALIPLKIFSGAEISFNPKGDCKYAFPSLITIWILDKTSPVVTS